MSSTVRTQDMIYNGNTNVNFYKKLKNLSEIDFKTDENKKDYSKTPNKFNEKDNLIYSDFLSDREKLQDQIDNHLKSRDIDSNQFKNLMGNYMKKFMHIDEKNTEEILHPRKIEPIQLMKGIESLKNKIFNVDLKETYMDKFLSIGKFDQGATLIKIK